MHELSASSLPPRSPQADGGTALPAHLYGTRAALFYLLREIGEPAPLALPTAGTGLTAVPLFARAAAPQHSAQILTMSPEPVLPARSPVRDMLMSDSFDFRD